MITLTPLAGYGLGIGTGLALGLIVAIFLTANDVRLLRSYTERLAKMSDRISAATKGVGLTDIRALSGGDG